MNHTPHKTFTGEDLKAIESWLRAYGIALTRAVEASGRAVKSGSSTNDREEILKIAHAALFNIRYVAPEPSLIVCPDALLAAPTLLRDMADMLEDFASRIGLKAPEPWTATKDV
jgi:hypothetical protein